LVVIKDESNLSIARLLRPLVDRMGNSGTLVDGEEMSGVIEENLPRGGVYGPREDGGGVGRMLHIWEGTRPRERWANRRHPDGRYL